VIEQSQAENFQLVGQIQGTHTPFFIQVMDTNLGAYGFPMNEILYVKFTSLAGAPVGSMDENPTWNMKLQFMEQR